MSIVVPAVLPSSRQDFKERLRLFAHIPSVNRVQIDVVDGRFATPASWPYTAPSEWRAMVRAGEMLPEAHRITYEIDLMCYDAERSAAGWLALGATRLTLHGESATDLPRLLASMRARYGSIVSYGIALNINSSLGLIESSLTEIDYVQLMGIAHIGKQGQPFDTRVLEKAVIFHTHHPGIPLQIDGGVSLANAKKLLGLGITSLVIGSGILKAEDPAAEVEKFEALESSFGV